jgi:hypothetical protein
MAGWGHRDAFKHRRAKATRRSNCHRRDRRRAFRQVSRCGGPART